MDALALLCNLHADGPLSLRCLRESGIRTLSDLRDASDETLVALLSVSAAQVRRIAIEAELLEARLANEPYETLEYAEPEERSTQPIAGRVPPPVASDLPLRAGEIEGLDAKLVERLVQEGVRTYRALIELVGLALARRAGVSYTRLLDVAYRIRTKLLALPASQVMERVIELAPARRLSTGSYRAERVFAGARLDPLEPRARDPARANRSDPGSGGPFV